MKRSSKQIKRRRYSESERQAIVKAYKTSGVSQSHIASQHGISPTTLQNWLRAHRKAMVIEKPSKLLPVRIVPGNCKEAFHSLFSAFEITLKSNRQLRIPFGFDPKEVRLLVKILEESC